MAEKKKFIDHFSNGKIKAKGHYKNDKKEGKWSYYDKTGQIEAIGH